MPLAGSWESDQVTPRRKRFHRWGTSASHSGQRTVGEGVRELWASANDRPGYSKGGQRNGRLVGYSRRTSLLSDRIWILG